MKPVQPLLLGLLLMVMVYAQRIRSRRIHRLAVLVLGAAGATLVVFPEFATAMAQELGVGRGVDLLIYVSLLCLSFALLAGYKHLREIDDAVAGLVREIALQRARPPIADSAPEHLPSPAAGGKDRPSAGVEGT